MSEITTNINELFASTLRLIFTKSPTLRFIVSQKTGGPDSGLKLNKILDDLIRRARNSEDKFDVEYATQCQFTDALSMDMDDDVTEIVDIVYELVDSLKKNDIENIKKHNDIAASYLKNTELIEDYETIDSSDSSSE